MSDHLKQNVKIYAVKSKSASSTTVSNTALKCVSIVFYNKITNYFIFILRIMLSE